MEKSQIQAYRSKLKLALEAIAIPISDSVALKRAGAKDISADNGSSLIEPTEEQKKEERDLMPIDRAAIIDAQVLFKDWLREQFLKMSEDSSWYELYKSITSEKDLAEKDQQRMVRRERRRIKRR